MDIKINKTPEGTLRYPQHSHKRYEIMHYISGDGIMRAADAEFPFSKGTVIVIPPNIPHGSISESGFVNISIEYDFNDLFFLDSPAIICGADNDEGEQLVRIIWENRYANDGYLHSLCTVYAQYLLKKISVEKAMSLCIRKIMRQITDTALSPEVDVTAILRQSGYAEDYIRMCFKQITGKTPTAFLTELRMKHACYLIDIYKNTLSLTRISEKCGYSDYIYFSKKFKEYVGISPRSYRDS